MKVFAAGLDSTTIVFLRDNGIAVEQEDVENTEDLRAWLLNGPCDAGVIDLEKSGLGIYFARGLRVNKMTMPLIGISRGSEDRVWGDHRAMFLENGGDDLLRGPENPRELVASLRAATRRFKGALLDIFECESGEARLKVNLTTKSVLINERPVELTGKELALMLLLASTAGRVLSKEMILTQLYTGGLDDEPEMKIIDVFVCKLRKKLTDAHPDAGKLIVTVWGRGYVLGSSNEPISENPSQISLNSGVVGITDLLRDVARRISRG